MFSALPLFLSVVITPFFFPHALGTFITTGFSVVLALLFGIALGVKNLILIHRAALLHAGAYVIIYITLLLFFIQAGSAAFLPLWLFTIFIFWLAFYSLLSDYRLALVPTVLLGELVWIASWLPIGFLNLTGICFVIALCMSIMVREDRVSNKNMALALAPIILIFVTSYWAI